MTSAFPKYYVSLVRSLCRRTVIVTSVIAVLSGCRKSEYNKVDNPAYLRVFNAIDYAIDISTKGKPVPFLTMVVDPQTDKTGLVTGGSIIGDFLDVRSRYAPPASNAAGTSYKNTEYPGKLKVPVAPIINGFDLSGWAQVPSGRHRFVFYTRPLTDVPFFSLSEKERKEQTVIADTVLELTAGEVYTMNVLEKDVFSSQLSTQVYLRRELFTRLQFADSLLYLNIYNLSAEGYAEAHPERSEWIGYDKATGQAIANTVNVSYSIFTDDVPYPYTMVNNEPPRMGYNPVPGYTDIALQSLERSQEPVVAPYRTVPMFAGKDTSGGIISRQWMTLNLASTGGGSTGSTAISLTNESDEGRRQVWNGGIFHAPGFLFPNLIRQAASGPYLQRSFATVSTLEFINKQIYLTSIQRTYEPPNR
jgi:hypothetical protein